MFWKRNTAGKRDAELSVSAGDEMEATADGLGRSAETTPWTSSGDGSAAGPAFVPGETDKANPAHGSDQAVGEARLMGKLLPFPSTNTPNQSPGPYVPNGIRAVVDRTPILFRSPGDRDAASSGASSAESTGSPKSEAGADFPDASDSVKADLPLPAAALASSTWIGSREIVEISLAGMLQLEPHGPRWPRSSFIRAILLTGLLALWCPAAGAEDGSLWDAREGFRYTNRKAMQVGDLVTILVTESASASNRSSLSTSKEHKVNIEGGPGGGALDFIPLLNLDSSAKNELDGSGQVSLSGQISTTLTVQVREIRNDGRLLLEGSRYIELNGEDEQVSLSGLARPEDIRSDNTILSTRLAEVKIHYTGKGAGKSASRPGIVQRVLSWIF